MLKDDGTTTTNDAATGAASPMPLPLILLQQRRQMVTVADSNGQAIIKSTGPGFRPLSEKQTLELVSPVTWETVDRYELNEYEIVTSIETDEHTKLVLLGNGYHPMEAMNVCYLIEGQTPQIAVADSEMNIRLLQYPHSKLIYRGDYPVGFQIQSTISIPKIVLSGTLDGGLRTITPILEKISKRLAL
ncbi:hypothetical protein BGZ65_010909 [Modicella reniformis]|uniref:Uncharacterized protein n=1 Tax=Modicella reniformis TaxID=1440133 RepID=A0A9P6JG84_9FUNG|nr:hypothetical protein BGZ65_010909 [Modicella reniformis]